MKTFAKNTAVIIAVAAFVAALLGIAAGGADAGNWNFCSGGYYSNCHGW